MPSCRGIFNVQLGQPTHRQAMMWSTRKSYKFALQTHVRGRVVDNRLRTTTKSKRCIAPLYRMSVVIIRRFTDTSSKTRSLGIEDSYVSFRIAQRERSKSIQVRLHAL